MLTHLDLFSGIGGFALACQWAGIETIGFVEIDKYCQKILRKHWPDVPIVDDIRDVERIKQIVTNATLGSEQAEQVQTGRNTSAREARRTSVCYTTNKPVTLITGGFPCQPFSVAGKREGTGDDRYLWQEMFNVIKEVRPTWVLGENVAGIVRMELDNCLSDLEGIGYSTQAFIIPACAVNAPHRRDRVWIVAHNEGQGIYQRGADFNADKKGFTQRRNSGDEWLSQEGRGDVPDTLPRRHTPQEGQVRTRRHRPVNGNWWAVESELGRVAHGIPSRVDRLKCLGNAIVPQVAYQILKVIAEIENG